MAYNLLTDRLPEELTVHGRRCPVCTDFRRWILVIELFAEEFVSVERKIQCAAEMIFPIPVTADAAATPEEFRSLAEEILWFAACGRPVREGIGGRSGAAVTEPVIDFTQDAERIAAAFRQTYGIDLCDPAVTLHFWTFMALLRNLPRETEFMRVVQLRMTDTAGIENDELRRQLRRAKARVRIRGNKEEGKETIHG